MPDRRFNDFFPSAKSGNRYINICDPQFAGGAVPDWNGSTGTDNQPAIQAAIDYCLNVGGQPNATILVGPKGRYRLGAPITIANQLISRGEGAVLGYASGTEFAFTHTQPGCIYLDTTPLGGQYFSGVRFEDIALTGVNQTVEQHAIMRVAGDMLSSGGLERVTFNNFTGACLYSPINGGNTAYDQNVAVRDVSMNVVGGFIGGNNTNVPFTLGLTITLLTLDNVNLANGVNTAFPQPAFFDYRYVRELYQNQTDAEGGGSITSVFRFGGNAWNTIKGVHVETMTYTNYFEFVTPPYQYAGGVNNFTTELTEIVGAGNNAINFNGCSNIDVLVDNWGTPLTSAIYRQTNGASGNTVRKLNTTTL